ncbi:unnamed protein product [Lymnaea stagnalis]|uniref:EGF-like domain-containing protein n=1 Tax=Lymnaea stagnalis TaxID=6523 RepID=A0AAV2HDD9_LYMST
MITGMRLCLLHGLTLALLMTITLCTEEHFLDVCDALYNSPLGDTDIKSADILHQIREHIFYSHLPKYGTDSGIFSKVQDAGQVTVQSWGDCLVLCCNDISCDVALYTKEKCFHIHCNESLPDSCLPVPSTNPKHNSTVMVVRKVKELLPRETALQEDQSFQTSPPLAATFLQQAQTTSQPVPIPASTAAPTHNKLVGEACTYGLLQCVQDAICEVKGDANSKLGQCQCTEGFTETAEKSCQLNQELTSPEKSTLPREPTKSPEPTAPPVTKLTVSAGQDKTIQLPINTVELNAFVIPPAEPGETYTYEWLPVQIPKDAESAKMDGKNTDRLVLSNLIAGLYVLKIKVTAPNKFGEALINVTVLPPIRENKPPVAIIVPASQEVYLPNSAILDGSGSTDDEKIVTFKWEEVSGPLKQDNNLNLDDQMLTLKDMAPGNYTFRLTVTDSDGASNSTQANVTIKKEKDYPPQADAGSDVVIHLPQNSLNLFGNSSSDDKGTLLYEWTNSADNKLTVGMVGVRSPILQLSNLEVGDYKFTLKVTDSSGQTDTADVHVFVKPETNHPPVARTAGHFQVFLPQESLTLDGINSTDDSGKMEYLWSQKGGPSTLTINNADKMVAIATGTILEGDYEFQLTVTDGELQKASDTLIITVKKDVNLPPKADAGGNQMLQLPVNLVMLDGSRSSDDRGITKYTWKRDPKSLAAGTVVNNSDHQAILQLVNLVAGQYLFTLTVEDADGQVSKDSATVMVTNNAHQKDIVEMLLDADIDHFTMANKESLEDQLELLLQKSSEDRDTIIDFITIAEDISSGHLCLTFQVLHRDRDVISIMNGVHALHTLKSKISSGKILDYSIVRLDLAVCQNNCSGHGHCDQKTKQCVCEAFWMPNFFTSSMFSAESNCDWSVLYVVIICFIILVTIISFVWAVICCCTSKQCKLKLKARRRHRYSLLRDADDPDKEKLEMLTKGKIQNSSVMISESDLSSDEETLFLSHKKAANGLNGKVANGTRPNYKSKLKT